MATYVVSDLHGYAEVFEKGIEKIGLTDKDMLYVIGDAIDRGPDGIRILQMIKRHKNMDLLIGNHELLMLGAVDPEGRKKCTGNDTALWLYYNGGNKTYEKYGRLKLQSRQSLLEWLRERYVMKTLSIEGRPYILTHSYYLPGYEDKRLSEVEDYVTWNIVWKSYYRDDIDTHGPDIYGNFDATFVTGHVPVHRIMQDYQMRWDFNDLCMFRKGNFICIDGGCAFGKQPNLKNGALFLRLEDETVFPVPLSNDATVW